MHAFSVIGAVLALCVSAVAADWSQFRGPTGDGHVDGKLPTEWGEGKNVKWKTDIPGRGYSSPVIGDGIIWVTTAIEGATSPEQIEALKKKIPDQKFVKQRSLIGTIELRALAVDAATGKVAHDILLEKVELPDPVHRTNSYASPTPVLDGGKLYCHFGSFGTFCLDAKTGKKLWDKKVVIFHSVGPGSSPMIYKNLLVLVCDGVDVQYVTALEKSNGREVWKTKRPPMNTKSGEMMKSFSTPQVITHNGTDQLVIPGAQWLCSYEPMTGKEIWRFNHGSGFSIVPRPVYQDGVVYYSTGFGKPIAIAVKVDGKGDVTKTHEVWREAKRVPARSSYVLDGNELYMTDDKGIARCFNAATGEILWTERLEGDHTASPIIANGHLYFCSERGQTTVIKAGKTFEKVAANKLDAGFMASPAVLGNSLILRTTAALYRID
jgi:outer membrane protein assembly factor BamB